MSRHQQTRREKRLAELASQERMNRAREATCQAVAAGCCPDCGSKLRSNLSLPGWWQCAQYGAIGFRADATREACSWQGFTK